VVHKQITLAGILVLHFILFSNLAVIKKGREYLRYGVYSPKS
jgi:hypothetical protein